MRNYALGFATAYGIAAVYWCAVLSAPGVVTPPGMAPIAAAAWPLTMARAFAFVPPKKPEVSP